MKLYLLKYVLSLILLAILLIVFIKLTSAPAVSGVVPPNHTVQVGAQVRPQDIISEKYYNSLDPNLKELHFTQDVINKLNFMYNNETLEFSLCLYGNSSLVTDFEEQKYITRSETHFSAQACSSRYRIHNHPILPGTSANCDLSLKDKQYMVNNDIYGSGIICGVNEMMFYDQNKTIIKIYKDNIDITKSKSEVYCTVNGTYVEERDTCKCIIDVLDCGR